MECLQERVALLRIKARALPAAIHTPEPQAIVHPKGLILPELDFGGLQDETAPIVRPGNIIIVAING